MWEKEKMKKNDRNVWIFRQIEGNRAQKLLENNSKWCFFQIKSDWASSSEWNVNALHLGRVRQDEGRKIGILGQARPFQDMVFRGSRSPEIKSANPLKSQTTTSWSSREPFGTAATWRSVARLIATTPHGRRVGHLPYRAGRSVLSRLGCKYARGSRAAAELAESECWARCWLIEKPRISISPLVVIASFASPATSANKTHSRRCRNRGWQSEALELQVYANIYGSCSWNQCYRSTMRFTPQCDRPRNYGNDDI